MISGSKEQANGPKQVVDDDDNDDEIYFTGVQ